MRFERLRLKNFAGVDEAEVAFSPTGITLIHGANETGKSTLMTAIDMLFDHRDDSNKKEVRDFRPLHRDEGAEVEAEIQVGPYRFTYMKRFHKDKKTELTIHEPRPESLTGREAHDRVREILDGSVDTGLWQALRILQGENSGMPELNDQRALATALDKAAGQALSGDHEDALFKAAYDEYASYFTDGGKEKDKPIGHARVRASEANAREKPLKEDLAAMDADIDRHAQVERSLATLRASLDSLARRERTAIEQWETVSRISEDRDRAQAERNLASASAQSAETAAARRRELVEDTLAAARKVEEARGRCAETSAALQLAESALESARHDSAQTAERASACIEDERLRGADLDFLKDGQELGRMKERLAHVMAADATAAQARALVASSKITDSLRTKIRKAEIALNAAQSILDQALPVLTISAKESLSLALGDEHADLEKGATKTLTVHDMLTVGIGQLAEVKVVPGTSADGQRQALREAQAVLTEACAKAGVGSPAEAEEAWSALGDAKRVLADRDRTLREHLGDLTLDALAEQVGNAEQRQAAYLGTRSQVTPLPSTLDEGRGLLDASRDAAATARSAQRKAEAVLAEVQEQHARSRETHAVSVVTLERELQDQVLATTRLEDARLRQSDDSLSAALVECNARLQAANDAFMAAVARLEEADPDTARAMMDQAVAAAKGARDTIELQDRELTVLRTRLDMQGEQGLAEKLAEASRECFEAEDSLQRLLRRAGAARLLYTTLEEERQAMRRAYVAPLREGIEKLGRYLFGPDFRVEVDEQLQVVNRTSGGVTVPIGQLSTGAQEQMGLLVRLAAASMVTDEGGVPLVLDDALGFTDQGRLEQIGAILGVASQKLQTIILTCAPERYQHVAVQRSIEMRR